MANPANISDRLKTLLQRVKYPPPESSPIREADREDLMRRMDQLEEDAIESLRLIHEIQDRLMTYPTKG